MVIASGATANADALATWSTLRAVVVQGEVPFVDGNVVVYPDCCITGVSATTSEFDHDTATLMKTISDAEDPI